MALLEGEIAGVVATALVGAGMSLPAKPATAGTAPRMLVVLQGGFAGVGSPSSRFRDDVGFRVGRPE